MVKRWRLAFSQKAAKELEKMDPHESRVLLDYLKKRIVTSHDPRSLGKPLSGPLKTFWRYRKGDYRIIVDIQDDVLLVQVIKIDHRKDIYDH
jgi:mRNA interferase RelE/StbE